MNEDLARLRSVLEAVSPLCRAENMLVRVSAERMAAIVVDALFELDPQAMDDPWDALPWVARQTRQNGTEMNS